ncbi:Ldh family oxidoreductase [Devosia sp. 1566]|uniref:Ldh family oxidoreductase n=1 Tax=Devosia sp. 1566 TaxID=2499144 RepID=UPI000FD6EFD5|nr:Ldh family oxidoreductase [Devosia sp. 1566]
MINIAAEDARRVSEAALRRAGVPPEAAALQVDLLLEAELRGRPSHGLLRLPRLTDRMANGVTSPTATGNMTWRSENFLQVNGQDGLGPVVAMAALELAAERARQSGVVVVAIAHSNHLGMLAWYAEKLAREGLVTLGFTTSEALVHAWGGRTPMLGTNPVAIGVPQPGDPFVLDMATSLVSMGQIYDYAQRGQELPEGWALDAEGEPTTDPEAAKKGSIAPFGEAKGYALGLALELLVVALTDSAIGRDVTGTLDSTRPATKGDVFILIDPDLQPGTSARIAAYLDLVRASGDAEGARKVAVPGDRAMRVRAERLQTGIALPEPLWAKLCELAGDPASTTKELT